ncbi:MAG: hypothetical protein JOZ86_01390 [Candidatus Eremiobacteraeota bacterium]|nr:hypothetical protein [Candidatus Eremiobacteraeota bacterium]
MKRVGTAVVAVLLTGAVASAQSYPGDTGSGVERGIQELNNSGAVGTVALYGRGWATRVLVVLHGVPDGPQAAKIERGLDCDHMSSIQAYNLQDVRQGRSLSTVQAPEPKLLSGNYNVVVFSSTAPGARPIACGNLYS